MDKPTGTTKERILEAACELFAKQGFQDTTTQQICALAEANIAAVHYHFRSKENLYREVWACLSAETKALWEHRIDVSAPPEGLLRQFVRFRAEAILSEGRSGWYARLTHWEMSHPSCIHQEIVDGYVRRKMHWFDEVVGEMLGDRADRHTVRLAAFCIHGPLVHLLEMRSTPRPPPPEADREHPAHHRPGSDPEHLIETLTTFALGGLDRLAAQCRKEEG